MGLNWLLEGMGLERQAGLDIEEYQIPQSVFKCIGKLGKALNGKTELCDKCPRKSDSYDKEEDRRNQKEISQEELRNETGDVEKEMLVWRVSFKQPAQIYLQISADMQKYRKQDIEGTKTELSHVSKVSSVLGFHILL